MSFFYMFLINYTYSASAFQSILKIIFNLMNLLLMETWVLKSILSKITLQSTDYNFQLTMKVWGTREQCSIATYTLEATEQEWLKERKRGTEFATNMNGSK
jgi:hypothetical protein